ncbi:MAG: hypothetical protein HZA66_12655 [Rhodopseudomonas palustris]|uniref:Uncharacterized protein n=1 Tax=Rhodopseudomonas palustris TaxID=1076 RepID=A0A933RX43_RHOPL|nr:hypothetical protein [Rhodopseudomonas palustris]
MPEVAKALQAGLAKAPDAVLKQALATPLGHLASFLGYADGSMPEVAKAIRAGLAKAPDAVLKQALATPLDQLASFLGYADGSMPEVAKAIRAGLAKDPDAVLKQALATPLEHLASFLRYADGKIPEVAKALQASLAKAPDAVLKQALATPLDHLASFLGYARTKMADVEKVFQNQLLTGVNLSKIVDRAVLDGPEKLYALCKHDRAYGQILPMIDVEAWSRRWNNFNFGSPSWFAGFASLCYSLNRDALVGPIAAAVVRIARAEDFSSPGITMRHLTFVVTAPHGCTPGEVERFFSRCITPDWLKAQYSSPDASVGALAGAVRSIAMSEQESVRRYFLHPALLQRLLAEQPTNGQASRHVAEWLQLLSATRLLGYDVTMRLQPMDSRAISEALKVWPPGPVDQGIQPIESGLWAGLREWCHIMQQPLIVASVTAEAILGQFRAADPLGRIRVAALNAVMIDWLERSQDQGWKLVADPVSLLHAVENQLRVKQKSEIGKETFL